MAVHPAGTTDSNLSFDYFWPIQGHFTVDFSALALEDAALLRKLFRALGIQKLEINERCEDYYSSITILLSYYNTIILMRAAFFTLFFG